MKLYLHFLLPGRHSEGYRTVIYESENEGLTIRDLVNEIVAVRKDITVGGLKILKNQTSKPLDNWDRLITSYFENNGDIFFYSDTPVAIPSVAPVVTGVVAPVQKQIHYETLKNYSFYESGEMWVKVLFPLNGVHTVAQQNISTRFLERSFEVKIHGLNGRNYSFAVPQLSDKINPELCKWALKTNEVVITLRKQKKESHWHSLFRTKGLGGVESD